MFYYTAISLLCVTVNLDLSVFRSTIPIPTCIVDCRVSFYKHIFYVFVVYVPSCTSSKEIRNFFQLFESLSYLNENTIIILGGYNVPACASDTDNGRTHRISYFCDLFYSQRRILDLVLPNISFEMTPVSLLQENNYHLTLFIIEINLNAQGYNNFVLISDKSKYNSSNKFCVAV